MKAKAFFKVGKPKETGEQVRQAGYKIHPKGSPKISSGSTNNTGQAKKNKTTKRVDLPVPHGKITRRTTVKQVGKTGRAK